MIVVLGCGFLGQYIIKELNQQPKEKIIATYRNNRNAQFYSGKLTWIPFDITKETDLANLKTMCRNEPINVFYLAGCHNIDYVYHNRDQARQVNVLALDRFLNKFGNIQSLFFASSDCVYGENTDRIKRFKETDETNPINIYGAQKKEAEQLVLSKGYSVVRLPYMLGPSLSKKRHFYDSIVRSLADAKPLQLIDGLRRSVLSYQQVAAILVRLLIEHQHPAILNIAGDTSYTKYEMGLHIANALGYSSQSIIKQSTAFMAELFVDARANTTVMDNQLLKKVLGVSTLEWECH